VTCCGVIGGTGARSSCSAIGTQREAGAAARAAGFVGHTIASAAYLRDVARPLLAEGAARANRDLARLRMTTQIVASASSDRRAARRDAAAQVGFYATPKGLRRALPGRPVHRRARRAARPWPAAT